jgi:hypothetical protein
MKWIGQHIYDQISRFRNDVYLEDISTGTIASGAHLGLDSNNKIVKAVDGGGDLTSIVAGTGLSGTSLTGPIPTLNVDASLTHVTSVGTIGTGTWQGTAIASAYLDADTAHLSGVQTFTGAKTFNEITSAVFDGNKTVTPGDGAVIHVDAHNVTDGGTVEGGTVAKYTHVNIEAPALLATQESVTTTAAASLYISGSPTAGTNQTLTNQYALWVDAGLVKFDGALTVGGTITGDVTGDLTGQAATVATIAGLAPNTATTQATQPNIESIGTDGDTLSILGDRLTMVNTTASKPDILLTNQADDATGPIIYLKNQRVDSSNIQAGEDNDYLGKIFFQGFDDGGTPGLQNYAAITSQIHDATSGEESGILNLQVANHDGGLESGLILTGGSADSEIDVTVGLGAASVVTIPGDIDLAGDIDVDGTLETDALTIGGSALTSIFYARSTITFATQATMLSSGNWVTTGQGGISNHSWNQDMGVNTETNGTSAGSLAKQYGHMGIRVPYACVIENIYAAIRNSSGNRQATVGLFCARAADGTTAVDWGTTDATEPILQIHADANNEGGSYQNRPTHAEASVDVAMAAGDVFYPAIKLTGVTSGGNTDTMLASFTVGIKTLIA